MKNRKQFWNRKRFVSKNGVSTSKFFAKNVISEEIKKESLDQIVFIDRIFASYREGLFNAIESKYALNLICNQSELNGFNTYVMPRHQRRVVGIVSRVSFLIKSLISIRPKVIISGDFGLNTVISILYSMLSRSKVIVWARLTLWSERDRGKFKEFVRAIVCHLADDIVVNGSSGAQYVTRFGAKNPQIIPQSSSHADLRLDLFPQEFESRQFSWVYIGRLVPEKGLIEFLKAFSSIPLVLSPTIKIIGEGPLLDEIKELSHQLKLSVEFFGHLEKDRMIQILDSSKCLFLPTHCDEWGLVLVESLARGTPILCSEFSGLIDEIFDPSEPIGITFDVFDPESILDAINEMIFMGRENWIEMSNNCRSALKKYEISDQEMGEKYIKLISNLISQNSSRRN